MKNVALFIFVALLNLIPCLSKSQTITPTPGDADSARGYCGYHPEQVDPTLRLSNPVILSSPKSTYTTVPASIIPCGKFLLYYEDILLATGDGFDKPVQGAIRRATVCAVYQYIQSVFDFSSIPASDPITIEIQQSSETLCPTGAASLVLASSAPSMPNFGTQGIKNGSVFDHLATGVSPVPSLFDARLYVNFCANGGVYYDQSTGTVTNCYTDLFSVVLHEVMHQMGFVSLLKEDPFLKPVSTFTNAYSNFDWNYLYHGTISPPAFQKFVIGTFTAPVLNPAVNSPNFLGDMQVWLNNQPRFKDNLPIYSGIFYPSFAAGFPINPNAHGSYASHLDGDLLSWHLRHQLSPGFMKPYVITPFIGRGEMRRQLTEQEIRILKTLGYTLNPAFATSTSICGCPTQNQTIINLNRAPFTTKKITNLSGTGTNTDTSYPDITQAADYSITNNGSAQVINLATIPSIQDLDGDVVKVEGNTLYNIRGCGNGGNNSNQLTVNPAGTIITFLPRTNFIGRAQFGFYLTDGKERGSFVIFTIDVSTGTSFTNTPNPSTPTGSLELVVNGSFEEGTQEKRTVSAIEEAINGNEQLYSRDEGKYFQGTQFSDAHPLQYVSTNNWTNNFGVIIGNNYKACSTPTLPYQYGSLPFGFPGGGTNHPLPPSGHIYSFMRGGYNYQRLSKPLVKCKRYILNFDFNAVNTGLAPGTTYTFSFQLESNYSYPVTTSLQTVTASIVIAAGVWQKVTVPFFYCPSTGANYLNLIEGITTSSFGPYYDNISLVEDLNPPPLTLTATASSNTVCIGSNTVTLNAASSNTACSVSYTWNPGNLSGPTVTVHPTVTTTYTVVMNDGCRTATATTKVNVGTTTPPLTLTASSSTICIGGSVTFTATGATTYTWNPGGILTNTATYTPSVSTTFTASGLLTGCITKATATIGIGVISPSITVSSNPPSGLCPGYSTATLTASGANTYTFTDGINIYPINPIIVSPTSTTIYTITGIDLTGCVGSGTFALNVNTVCICAASSGVFPASLTNTTIIGGSYAVNQDLFINGSVFLANVELIIAPGVSITVVGSSTLEIGNSHLYSCFDMWSGIVLDPASRVRINNGTLIEDAFTSISSDGSTITSLPYIIDVEDCVFNRNLTAIAIQNYSPAIPNYPFSIKNSVFTSRQFTFTPTSWPQTGLLQTVCTVTNTLMSPYCLINAPFAFCKSPITVGAEFGVKVVNSGQLINPTNSLTINYFDVFVGDSLKKQDFNLYDNLAVGIYALRSSVRATNSVFQNGQQISRFVGTGILSDASDDYLTHLKSYSVTAVTSGGTLRNTFYDLYYGIRIINNYVTDIFGNNFFSQQQQSGYTPIPSYRGYFGISITSDRFEALNVSDNKILNHTNPISLIATYGKISLPTFTGIAQYAGKINIDRNDIKATNAAIITTEFISNAITLQQPLTPPLGSSTFTSTTQLSITDNKLKDVYRGVFVQNWNNGQHPNIVTNTITLVDDLITGSATQYGVSAVNSSTLSIYSNNVRGTGISNGSAIGIYTSINNNLSVTCNAVRALYEGFEFAGSQPITQWDGNSMRNHKLGFVLSGNGLIGTQGTLGAPIDNQWLGAWGGLFQTFTLNSFAITSPLYTQAVAPFYPTFNNAFPPPNLYLLGSSIFTTTGAYACSPPPPVPPPPGGGGTGNVLNKIAQDSIPFIAVINESKFIHKNHLHRALKNDSTLMVGDTVLQNFYTANLSTSKELIANIETNLSNGNTIMAQGQITTFVTSNNIESNYKDFFDAYRKYSDSTYTSVDSLTIVNLAYKCPFIDGVSVYQARALYNLIYNTIQLFRDNCPAAEDNGRLMKIENQTASDRQWNVNIHPNPASNDLFITSSNDKEDIKIFISDVNGRLVMDNQIKTDAFVGKVRLELNNGIYFVTLINQNGCRVVKKLVISK